MIHPVGEVEEEEEEVRHHHPDRDLEVGNERKGDEDRAVDRVQIMNPDDAGAEEEVQVLQKEKGMIEENL